MTANKVYYLLLEDVNKNAINDNIAIDPFRAVLHINQAQDSILENYLSDRSNSDVRKVSKFLVTDTYLTKIDCRKEFCKYKLPDDLFDFTSIKVYADNDYCSNIRLNTFEVKPENVEQVIQDEFNKPSLKFRETFYNYSEDYVLVYKDDFEVSNVLITYYRKPRRFDFKGYTNIDTGNPSSNIELEWDDKMTSKIIKLASSNFLLANNDPKYSVNRQIASIK